MKDVKTALEIPAPPQQVFAAIANPRKPFLTENQVTHMEVVSQQTSGVGTIYRWKFSLPFHLCFQFDEIVTAWDEPVKFSYQAISGWEMEATNLLSASSYGTYIEFTLRYRAPGLWHWLIPKWLVRLGIRQSLINLRRRVIETRGGQA